MKTIFVCAVAIILALLLVDTTPAHAATINVTANATDTLNGADGQCSLREAIANINDGDATYADCLHTGSYGTSDTVNIPAGTYTTSITTYVISKDISIAGAGAGTTIIDGNALGRVFYIADGPYAVAISGVTIQNGSGANYGGGIAIWSGTLTIANSSITGNTAGVEGGAIYNWFATLTITNSTISSNTAYGGWGGGGIFNVGPATISNSTITGNTAANGKAGGGIFQGGSGGALVIVNSTISGNAAATGGGIRTNGDTVTLSNSIVASQTGGADCSGSIISAGHNLESGTSCGFIGTGDLQNTAPLLGALASNGGTTQTMALQDGSPAINAGDNAICAAAPVNGVDQRGYIRPAGANCDIGAFEYGALNMFNFIAQTQMPLSTVIVSNPITVAGISYSAPLSIGGNNGEYKINSSSWTSGSGTVNSGDIVMVRQTTSSSNSTLTTTTLNIGGVTAEFNVTTAAAGDPNGSGLVSWWKGEDNTYDSVGGNHGATINGATYAAGQIDQAFSFDGANDYVNVSPGSAFDFGTGDFSISLWVNFNDLGGEQVLMEKFEGSTGPGWTLTKLSGNNIRFYVSGAAYYDVTPPSLATGTWNNITVTRESGLTTIFWNGTSIGSHSIPDSIQSDSSLRLGSRGGSGYFLNGQMDDIKIFSRALSAREVLRLVDTSGLASWWKGNDNALDSIGNNDGTWQGTPAYGPGMAGKALVFDGVENYLQISAQSGSLDVSSEHSLDMWIKLDGYPTAAAYILNKWVSGVEDKLLVVLPDGRVGYYLHNAFGGSGVVSSTKLVIGRWYHLAATYDGSEARLYINSSLDAVKGAPGVVSNGNGTLYLGFNPLRNSSEPHDHLKGMVDEIKWHNRALSASEVAGSYGLVSWWKGENNASDSVGNNHGTAMNGAAYGDGTAGRAFSLNGVDGNYVSIPDNSSLRISGDVTVSAYIKRSGLSNGAEGGIITKGASMVNGVDVPSNYFLEIDGSDHLVAGFERADGTNAILAGPALTDLSSFHHVVYVRQGASHSLYLDGAQVVTESFAGVPGDTTGLELTIGAMRESAQYSYVFKGLIDEVKIFSRALSVVEISQLAGTLPAPFIFTPVTDAPLTANIVSNAVTVAGVSNPAPIAIAGGGTYRINSGECTATSGTINPGDTVALCLTSAGAYSTTTSAALTIGGVTGTFTVTTAPDLMINPVTTPTSLVSPTISGTVKSGAAVTVSVNGGSSRSASVTGTSWSYTLTGLVRGNNDITVSAADTGYAPAKSATIECSAPQLTVNVTATSGISGSGGGTVTSDPSSIACISGPCAALFDGGSTVPLMATPDVNSLFGSWSGACSGTNTNCNVLMDGDKSAAALFTYVEPARIQGGDDYPHISAAYAAMTADGTILARQFQFDGGLTLDQGWKLLLKGGYNAAYSENSGYSTIAGALTVKHGRLTVERVLVK